MKRLYLVRHGHTIDNELFRYSGFSDCGLSKTGKEQVKGLTEYLKDIDVNRIYTSTLRRTSETIGSFAEMKNIEITKLGGLREINFGLFDGLSYAEIKEKYPKEASEIDSLNYQYRFPEGETLKEFFERNASTLDDIIEDCKDVDNVLICAHMGTIRNLLSHILVKDWNLYWNFNVHNATVSIIDFYGDIPIISMMGYIPYDKSLIRTYPKDEK